MELADGFVFLPAHTADDSARTHLGRLLEAYAAHQGLTLCGVEFDEESSVSQILERLRSTTRPALFWIHGGLSGRERRASLDQFYSLLNQKRDVIAQLVAAPLIMAMHPREWQQFRGHAPDFWSIHHRVFRFSPGLIPGPSLRGPITHSVGGHARFQISGWRVLADQFAQHTPPRFFGRESEIGFLISALASPGARICIRGPQGSGRTTLLHHTLPRVADYFPDGIWWVPFNLSPDAPQDRARTILERLVGELMSMSGHARGLEELAALFRTGTASMDALFVFEDVDDLAAVGWLTPGARASMLLTTDLPNPELPGDIIDLGGLGVGAGAALLQVRAKLDPETARRVASAAGGQPAVLNLLATLLAAKPEIAPLLIDRMSDDSKSPGDGELSAALDAGVERIFESLSPEAQALWPKVGLFHEHFSTLDAAAVGADAPAKIKPALVELARTGLIEPMVATDQYRCFALLRESSQRRLHVQDDSTATWIAYARRVLLDRRPLNLDLDARTAIDWLREQLDNGSSSLRANIQSIAEEILEIWANNRVADDVMLFTLEWFEAQGDEPHLARVYEWFGSVSLERDRALEAKVWYRRELAIGERLKDDSTRALAYAGLGDVARGDDDDNNNNAREHYRRALDLTLEQGSKSQLSKLHRKLAEVEANSLPRAAAAAAAAELHYHLALDAARQVDDFGEMAASYRGLADLAHGQGRLEDAVTFAHKSIDSREPGDMRGTAADFLLLGTIAAERGDLDTAREWHERAITTSTQIADWNGVAWGHFLLGNISAKSGDLRAAESHYDHAYAKWLGLQDVEMMLETCFSMARVLSLEGKLDDAAAQYARALELARENGSGLDVGAAHFFLGELAAKRGDHEQAVEHWVKTMTEMSVETRPRDEIELALLDLHAAAPPPIKPRLYEIWTDAGLEWPVDDEWPAED